MIKLEVPNLTIRQYQEIPQWDAFVESHPQGTILHSTRMIQCEEGTKLHYPHAYGALDSSGKLCALLVAVRISTLGGVPGPLTSRSILHVGPIYLDSSAGRAGVRQLLKKHDEYMRKKTLFAEVRPVFEIDRQDDPLVECGFQRHGYLNYELWIDAPEIELFDVIGPKCRNNVRGAQRKGVVIEEIDAASSIDLIYSLLSESYAHARVPMVDRTLFQFATNLFSRSQLRVMLAKHQGVPIAVGCFLMFKKRIWCWYAGTKRVPGVPAMSCIFWEAIRMYSREGFEVFDFAGGGWEGEDFGPGIFKAKFGGQQTNFGRYRKIYAPWMMKAAESVYEHVRDFIAPRAQRFTP